MTFSWILGRRQKYSEDVVEDQVWPPSQEKAGRKQQPQDHAINVADIKLSIEGGLLMAFSPLGDPITPELLRDACARQPRATLRLPNGDAVDHKQLIAVIEAQQAGRLAERPNDGWVEAMLGIKGSFESTSSECLASEGSEDQSVVAGKLVFDMPGGETITLYDDHPGNRRSGPPARLLVDGKPVSVAAMLGRNAEAEFSENLRSATKPSLSVRDNHLALLLDDQIEARLETASAVWDGEAKVALLLEDGRPVSVDDLTALLCDIPPCLPPETQASAPTYPLFGDDRPALELDHATIITISNMPKGWSLTTGKRSKRGSWILDPSSLKDTAVRVVGQNQGPQSLHVKVISAAGHDGKVDQQIQTIVIPPNAGVDDARPELSLPNSNQGDQVSSSISLVLDHAETNRADGADALLLRGIPEGASLSSGVFDPSVKGWILKPDELGRLTIHDLDHMTGDFEIEFRAFYLDQEGQTRSYHIVSKIISRHGSSTSAETPGELALARSR